MPYSISEVDNQKDASKAAECFAYVPLFNNSQIANVQAQLRERFTDSRIEWQTPDTFHVTLCYVEAISDDGLDKVVNNLRFDQNIEIVGVTLDVFDTPDGWAVHIPVDFTQGLYDVQSQFYSLFWEYGEGFVPEHFEEEQYKPHITLAYFPKEMKPPVGDTVSIKTTVDQVVIGRDNYRPYQTITLSNNAIKSAPTLPPALDFLTEDAKALWQKTYEEVLTETGDTTKAQLAAWGAVKRDQVDRRLGLKSTDDGRVIVEGWGMLFTDSDRLDLDKQYFNDETLHLLEYYEGAPLFYNHSGDVLAVHRKPIGKRTYARVYPRGIYVEHELDQQHPLYEQIAAKIKRGELYYSSDTLAHMARDGYRPEDGYLGLWPVAGWSLTESPAEPGLGPVTFSEQIAAIKAAKQEKSIMDETLKNARKFFGLSEDAPLADVQNAATAFQIAVKMATEEELTAEEKQTAEEMDIQAAEVEGKNIDTVLTMLGDIMAYLQAMGESEGEDMPEPTAEMDMEALEAASKAAKNSKAVANRNIPHVTNGESRKGYKSHGRSTPFVMGKAQKPSLGQMVKDIVHGKKDHVSTIGPLGGYLVRDETSTEIIESLQAKTVVLEAGATRLDISGLESFTLPKSTSTSTVDTKDQLSQITASDFQFDAIEIRPRTIAALVRVSREMLARSAVNLDAFLRRELERDLRRKMDYYCLLGTGSQQPLGIVNQTGVTTTSLGANGAKPKFSDLTAAIGRVEDANVDIDSGAWLMAPRSKRVFADLADADGSPLMRNSWALGEENTILGYPYYTTTQIPTNLTVGTKSDNSYVIFGNMSDAVVAMSEDVEIMVDEYERFSYNQVQIRAIMAFDFAVRHPESFEVLSGVRS